jgi:hypothetical protein
MSLLQGQSSHLQDFEIDAQHPVLSDDVTARPWDESFIVAIKLARIQGQIYNNLYSTLALKSSSSDRLVAVNSLESAMRELRLVLEQV